MPTRKGQSANEDLKYRRTVATLQFLSPIFLSIIRCTAVCVFMFFVYRTVEALAGRQTAANIDISGGMDLKFLANRYASQIVFFLFGSGGILYGVRQKALYAKAVKQLRRLKTYEKQLDPNRSSSEVDDDLDAG